MSTTEQLSENSHQGFEGIKAALCLAEFEANSNRASGMAACLRPNGTGSRCSGKERDAESGLDYFGARYYSGAQGRFTSADPFNIILDAENREQFNSYLAQPQNWNKYAYTWNNPLRYIDPNGEAVELLGDEEARKKELALLQSSLGNKDAASRLYINSVGGGENTRYFVGIRGDVGEFMKLGETSHDLANLVGDKRVVEFGLTSMNLTEHGGAATFEPGKIGNQNVRVLVNPSELWMGDRTLRAPVSAFKWEGYNQIPPFAIRGLSPSVATWHEFGHAWGMINGRIRNPASYPESLDWENRMRLQVYGPFGPQNARRIRH